MSEVSEPTSTAPPAAGPLASAMGAAYRRSGRPSNSMSSAPVRPRRRAARSSASSGRTRAPRFSERATILPRRSTTSTEIWRPETGLSSAPGSVRTAGVEMASSATSWARWRRAVSSDARSS